MAALMARLPSKLPGLRLGATSTRRRAHRSVWLKPAPVQAAAAAQEDMLLRSLSDCGQVSVLVVQGKSLVQEACNRHATAPTASAALGRALLGTLLMACFRGEGEKTQITFRGDGPLGHMQTVADASGMVKGKVSNPAANPPLRSDGKLNVGKAVGRGMLAVVRSLPMSTEPYTGITKITSGEVAEDLAQYLLDSEQTQSAIALGVSINQDLGVEAAGGYLIQVLPFAEDETLAQLEANIAAAGSVTSMLEGGATPQDITQRLLQGLGCSDAGFELRPQYGPCDPTNLQDRMRSAVAALGEAEVKDIIEEQGHVEVTCEFCNDTYRFGEEELLTMVRTSKS